MKHVDVSYYETMIENLGAVEAARLIDRQIETWSEVIRETDDDEMIEEMNARIDWGEAKKKTLFE